MQRETINLPSAGTKEKTVELIFALNNSEDYSTKIKAYRKKNSLTQEELASIMGVSHPTLRSWEQKLAKPPYNVWRLHKHLFSDTIGR